MKKTTHTAFPPRGVALFFALILSVAMLAGCVSQSGPEEDGTTLNAKIEYTLGDILIVRNDGSWTWSNIVLEINDSYTCTSWDISPGYEEFFSVSEFTDSEGNEFDYLHQTGEKIVLTCEDPDGETHSCTYRVSEAYSTVPEGVDTEPISASEAQAALEAWEEAYEAAPAKVQERREALEALLQAPDIDYNELYQAFDDYKTALDGYQSAYTSYYSMSILLEHTTPIEGDLLEIRKDTLPFDRPDGPMCTFGSLNVAGEEYMIQTNNIKWLIQDGFDGQDTRQDIIDALKYLEEELLPNYHSMEIGYVYYSLCNELLQQSLYSDVLIYDCNPYCFGIYY